MEERPLSPSGFLPTVSLMESVREVATKGWYWGQISARDAYRLLNDKPIGTFLVRDSQNVHYIFTIVFRSEDGIKHSRISHYKGKFCLGGIRSPVQASSFVQFIETLMECSEDPQRRILTRPEQGMPSEDVILSTPLDRFQMLPCLKYLCRIVIRERVKDVENLDELPLPNSMKKYIKEEKYLLVHYSNWETEERRRKNEKL